MAKVTATNGRIFSPLSKWFSAQDLAGLPGMPQTARGVQRRAETYSWSSRKRRFGKGLEYRLAALDATTQAYIKSLAESLLMMAGQDNKADNENLTRLVSEWTALDLAITAILEAKVDNISSAAQQLQAARLRYKEALTSQQN